MLLEYSDRSHYGDKPLSGVRIQLHASHGTIIMSTVTGHTATSPSLFLPKHLVPRDSM
jgi:hypothetical protein